MKIISLVGARPNFMKIAPFIRAIDTYNKARKNKIEHTLIHTGQHYDIRMSKLFFDELQIPYPDINLEVGSGTHAEQVGLTMIKLEKEIRRIKPDMVVVVGDVNAILAGAVTAKKELVPLAHIEAGLRSGDMTMPEEINRLVADKLSDLLFTPDEISNINLIKEGVPEAKIKFVGNIMIDTFYHEKEKALALNHKHIIQSNSMYNQTEPLPEEENYALVTMHRPSNVDTPEILEKIINFFTNEVVKELPIIWPIHPRTITRLQEFGLMEKVKNTKGIFLLHPVGYHEMIKLNSTAKVVMTDSGGLQEESTVLGTPCLTMRWNTERPVTLLRYGGTSSIVGNDVENIRKSFYKALEMPRNPRYPLLWDGHTAPRIVNEIVNFLETKHDLLSKE